LTCVDRLFDCARVQDYGELSAETKAFISEIEQETGVPVTIISTGPDLKDTIDLRKELL
jgi:adenylosuccinate synthase